MANYSLQIILPRASGTVPDVGRTAMDSGHRIFWAYPSINYNIRAAVVGGTFPYTFSLSGAPSGMTINASTGEINWTATGDGTNSGTITLTVEDAETTQATTSWAIAVSASRFKFFDSEAGSDGTGTFASPYNTLTHIRNGDASASHICYFRGRATAYTLDGLTTDNTGSRGLFRYTNLRSDLRSAQWIAYPGDSSRATLDFRKALEPVATASVDATNDWFVTGQFGDIWATGDPVVVTSRVGETTTAGTLPAGLSTGTTYYLIRVDATHVRFATSLANAQANTYIDITDQGSANSWHTIGNQFFRTSSRSPIWFDNMDFVRMPNKGINIVNDTAYRTIRRCNFTTQYGGGNEQNSGMIMIEGNGRDKAMSVEEYPIYQDNVFDTWTDSSAVKIYAAYKMLIENNTFRNGTEGSTNVCEGLALKGGAMEQPTVRQNTIHTVEGEALAGNNDVLYGGEYLYNLVYNVTGSGLNAMRVNQNGSCSETMYYHRNTIVGKIMIRDGIEQSLPAVPGYNFSVMADSDAGPFLFTNNVIVTSDSSPYYTLQSVETGGTVTMTTASNLIGAPADGIVDASGALQGAYLAYVGSRGYQLAEGEGAVPEPVDRAPYIFVRG